MPPKSPASRLDLSRRSDGHQRKLDLSEVSTGVLPYEEVDFSGNSLSAVELPSVLKICKRCPKLRVLKLYKNSIDDYGAQALADLCRAVPGLEEIHLSHNMFTAAGASIIIKAAEEFRRPDTVPLWLRLEHNYIDDAERVFQGLQTRYSVCRRTDPKLCTARTCYNRCRVHLPHFCLQRLSQLESNEIAKSPPTNGNGFSRQIMRQFKAELVREKDKVKKEPQMEYSEPRMETHDRVEPRDMHMYQEPRMDSNGYDRHMMSWAREADHASNEGMDFGGFTAGPASSGPKPSGVHPQQLVDPGSCQEFVCQLCNGVIHDPTLTRCSHIFCSDCFQSWVTNRVKDFQHGTRPGSSMQNMPCPKCGEGLRKCDIVPLHHARHAAALVLQRCWSNVRIRCIHHPQHFQYPFGSYAQQLSDETGIECSWLGNLCDYASHINTCPVQQFYMGTNNLPSSGHHHQAKATHPEEGRAEEDHGGFASDEICVALWDYAPVNNPGKLELIAGDKIRVYKSIAGGWTGGCLLGPDMQEVGEAGWFPTTYVDLYDERYYQWDQNFQQEEYAEGFDVHPPYGEMYGEGYAQFEKSYAAPEEQQYGEMFQHHDNENFPKQYSELLEKNYGEGFEKPFGKQYGEPLEKSFNESFDKQYGGSFEKSYEGSYAQCYDDQYDQWYDESYVQYGYTM